MTRLKCDGLYSVKKDTNNKVYEMKNAFKINEQQFAIREFHLSLSYLCLVYTQRQMTICVIFVRNL